MCFILKLVRVSLYIHYSQIFLTELNALTNHFLSYRGVTTGDLLVKSHCRLSAPSSRCLAINQIPCDLESVICLLPPTIQIEQHSIGAEKKEGNHLKAFKLKVPLMGRSLESCSLFPN